MSDSLKNVLASVPEDALRTDAPSLAPSIEEVLLQQQNAPSPLEMELQGIRDRYRSEVEEPVQTELGTRLRDDDFVEALAVARAEGNDLATEALVRLWEILLSISSLVSRRCLGIPLDKRLLVPLVQLIQT